MFLVLTVKYNMGIRMRYKFSPTNKNHMDLIRPFYKARAPVRLRLPVTQESTKSLKALLVLHANTFELTKPSIMQVIILK